MLLQAMRKIQRKMDTNRHGKERDTDRLQWEINDNRRNKAGYTATKVACGWAGAIFEVTRPFGRSREVKVIKS